MLLQAKVSMGSVLHSVEVSIRLVLLVFAGSLKAMSEIFHMPWIRMIILAPLSVRT